MPATPQPSPLKRLYYILPAAVFAATVAIAGQSLADGYGSRLNVQDKLTQEECGACHMAYPAGLLSADAWRAIMVDLPNHFGEDASLDEETRKHIENYLVTHTRWQSQSNNSLRISEQNWFVHEHKREVSNRQFAKAKSWSNCPACHMGAAKGNFEDEEEHEGWFGDRD